MCRRGAGVFKKERRWSFLFSASYFLVLLSFVLSSLLSRFQCLEGVETVVLNDYARLVPVKKSLNTHAHGDILQLLGAQLCTIIFHHLEVRVIS